MSRFYLEIQTKRGIDTRSITPGPKIGIAEGACPGCKTEPFRVHGGNRRAHSRDTWIADGRCVDCNDPVGYLYEKTATFFGVKEDENMLVNGRCRVYY